ncbi:TetR/AcrR family transcriptional regulator [Streptomyces sp. NPDC058001]|uniref:TetR/AcrR family transcriptional regulator n=1 Tax=Streptomyces sp. NPDC058001 TaxID=3346300 RepID=UPI0036ED0F16
MTKPAPRVPQRSNSRSNRARILAVARHELGRNPDVSLEDIAQAAGVVRRTLYGHFPGRLALLEALADEAADALRDAVTEASVPDEPYERALGRFVLAIWPIGDRYRMLLALARHDLGAERVSEVLAPARREAIGILKSGRRAGVFHDHVPADVLSTALEALVLSLLESVNTGAWEDDQGGGAAVATLIAAGVPAAHAEAEVRGLIAARSRPDTT